MATNEKNVLQKQNIDDTQVCPAKTRGITIHFSKNKWVARAAGTLLNIEEFSELELAEQWAKNKKYNIHGVYNR